MMKQTRSRTFQLAACGVMTAVLCVLGPFSIPIGPVPVTLATLVIYLAVELLGWKWGTVSVVVYLLLGMAGVPVFSNYLGGAARLLGPTGGYLVGYVPLALIAGWVAEATRGFAARGMLSLVYTLRLAGMVLGTAVLYTLGTAWFCVQGGYTVDAAMAMCVTPFLPFDLIKMVLALGIGTSVRHRLELVDLL